MKFYLRPQAEADLEDIALYIAEDNVQAARRWIEDMHALCQQLGEMPSMGVAKSSIRPGLRMLPAGSYLILYQQVDKGVEIAWVLHGARQWQDLL
jgi:toxin ParE1/3/4